MAWYIGKRLAAALVTVWIVATAGFLLVEIIPGDPARQLAGPGASAEWGKVMDVFGFASEAEALAYRLNPVDRLAPLAEASIPILHVYGDADEAVPWDENTGVLAERYRAMGGHIELIAKPGCAHHPHGLDDPSPIVDFIWRHCASANGMGERGEAR